MNPRNNRLADAADLALLGVAAFLAALPILTLGASAAAASAAVHDLVADGSLPSWRVTVRRYVRALLPGAGAALAAIAAGTLLVLDLRALAAGAVPGGAPLYVLTLALALFLLGAAGVTVTEVGCGLTWRAAFAAACRRPTRSALAAGVTAVAAILAWAVPVTAPIVAAVVLYALHVVRARADAVARRADDALAEAHPGTGRLRIDQG